MDCYQNFGYCDASAIAYAAVIYLVETTSSGKHSSFVVAKTRVSPLKSQTIPRLELLSARKTYEECHRELGIKAYTYHTKMFYRLTDSLLLDQRHRQGLEAIYSKSSKRD